MKILLVSIFILILPSKSQSQSVADSVYAIQLEFNEVNRAMKQIYYNNRPRFYEYMVEHFPSGSGTINMRMEFGGIIRSIEDLIFDLKLLRINISLNLDSRIPDDLRFNEETFSTLIESWDRKFDEIKSTEDYLVNHNYRSYTIPSDIMQMYFLPSVTNFVILLRQSANMIRSAQVYIEENRNQILTSEEISK